MVSIITYGLFTKWLHLSIHTINKIFSIHMTGKITTPFSYILLCSALDVILTNVRRHPQLGLNNWSFNRKKKRQVRYKLVSSQAGSFIFFKTFLTSFSRSFRALCSSSKDFFIFLLSCLNSWTSSFNAYTVSTRLFSSITV